MFKILNVLNSNYVIVTIKWIAVGRFYIYIIYMWIVWEESFFYQHDKAQFI